MSVDAGYKLRTQSLFWKVKGYNPAMSKIYKSILAYSISDEAKFRMEVIDHFNKFGLASTKQAFKIGKSTIYRWKNMFKKSKGILSSLIPKSRRPKKIRQMTTDIKLLEMIVELRKLHPRIGKRKIKPILDKYAIGLGIKPIAIDTIGKVIKRNHLFYQKQGRMYHNPSSKVACRRISYKSKVKHSPITNNSGYVEIDTITLFVDGIKRYVYHALDIQNKFDFAYTYKNLNSQNTVDFIKKFNCVYPIESGIKTIQTDNGLEFLGDFHQYLLNQGINHLFTYPRCPKINGFIERSNRSLKEEFIYSHMDLLSIDLNEFNQELIKHLVWYNTERPHQSLNFMTPIDYLLKKYPESHMYTARTIT
jgi:hypothetical protein